MLYNSNKIDVAILFILRYGQLALVIVVKNLIYFSYHDRPYWLQKVICHW